MCFLPTHASCGECFVLNSLAAFPLQICQLDKPAQALTKAGEHHNVRGSQITDMRCDLFILCQQHTCCASGSTPNHWVVCVARLLVWATFVGLSRVRPRFLTPTRPAFWHRSHERREAHQATTTPYEGNKLRATDITSSELRAVVDTILY